MNVFIKEKESGNYYNLFDVSTVNISTREWSEEKHAIDIHVFNDTFHVYAGYYLEKEFLKEEYKKLWRKIRNDNSILIGCDFVHAMPVSR